MYKLRLWNGPGKESFIQLYTPVQRSWHHHWKEVTTLEEGSELTIAWIQENLGDIYEIVKPERLEILQVREHANDTA